jgi:hypothetical protein
VPDHQLVGRPRVEAVDRADRGGRLRGGRHQHDVVAAEDPPDVRAQRALDRVGDAQQRAERAPEPDRAAGARVELRAIRHVQLDPLAYPARRSRHEAEAHEAVLRVGLLDVVAESLERAREPLDLRAHGGVERRRRERPRDLRRERDPQPAGLAAGALGERLPRRRRPVHVLGAVAGEHVEQQRRVVDRARERPDAGEAVE